jgi:hypothetical protein
MINYIEILNIIKDKNIELRHDVDVSIISAYNIAKIEHSMNVKSIYYLRFDCDYYNILSIENKKIIEFLKENHEIGCHVDVTNIKDNDDLIEYLSTYNEIIPFNKFTFHINSNKTKNFGEVKNFINKSLLNGMYISDSRNSFNEEKIEILKNNFEYTLLLHPEWWDNKDLTIKSNSSSSIINSLRLDELTKKTIKEILNE